MEAMEWIKFCAGGLFLICGIVFFALEMIGVFLFRYVLNRMHAAAMGDTLGIGFSMLGLMIICGFNFTSLKMLCVVIFLWFSSPTSSHLIARLEVNTDEEPDKHYQRKIIESEKEEQKEV